MLKILENFATNQIPTCQAQVHGNTGQEAHKKYILHGNAIKDTGTQNNIRKYPLFHKKTPFFKYLNLIRNSFSYKTLALLGDLVNSLETKIDTI